MSEKTVKIYQQWDPLHQYQRLSSERTVAFWAVALGKLPDGTESGARAACCLRGWDVRRLSSKGLRIHAEMPERSQAA